MWGEGEATSIICRRVFSFQSLKFDLDHILIPVYSFSASMRMCSDLFNLNARSGGYNMVCFHHLYKIRLKRLARLLNTNG